ncbi:unnamed protein product [Linum trigynum]|uniref:Uncharacterized protein n=1 Tax=Linum trigynum TaxID=586398 RepID=A0AAV2F009_9ROSI
MVILCLSRDAISSPSNLGSVFPTTPRLLNSSSHFFASPCIPSFMSPSLDILQRVFSKISWMFNALPSTRDLEPCSSGSFQTVQEYHRLQLPSRLL